MPHTLPSTQATTQSLRPSLDRQRTNVAWHVITLTGGVRRLIVPKLRGRCRLTLLVRSWREVQNTKCNELVRGPSLGISPIEGPKLESPVSPGSVTKCQVHVGVS